MFKINKHNKSYIVIPYTEMYGIDCFYNKYSNQSFEYLQDARIALKEHKHNHVIICLTFGVDNYSLVFTRVIW